MKIERISENQIRCTLTSEDLASRQLRISELALGSEKAKNLFRDMMQQAHIEFGFEADNIPLMIEAMPSSSGLVLIITKVDDPEELDHRFAKFDQPPLGMSMAPDDTHSERADDILDIFKKIYEAKAKAVQRKKAEQGASETKEAFSGSLSSKIQKGSISDKGNKTSDQASTTTSGKEPFKKVNEPAIPVDLMRLYEFGTLDGVIEAAFSLNNYYKGINSLYKDERHGIYMLVLHQSGHTPEEFNRVCNILSEYASGQAYSNASEAYLQEHKDVVIGNEAIQRLSQLK